jgi:hypothetical protein
VLCIVAACALLAVSVVGAQASAPALYECAKLAKNPITKKYDGGYEKGCTTVNPTHEGKYEFQEWSLAAKKGRVRRFKTKGKPSASFEMTGVGATFCSDTKDEGEVTGPETVGNVTAVFTGCEDLGEPCENAAPGEIKIDTLDGIIGYVSKARHEVGVDLSPASGSVMTEFHCGRPPASEIYYRTEGSIVGLITSPLNTFTREYTVHFEQRGGTQLVQELEGLSKDVPLTAYCRTSAPPCAPQGQVETGAELLVTNKGEDLYLKA